jgi:pyrethroid hydrolase
MQHIEIRYLDAVWSDPETVIMLECGHNSIEIEPTSSGWLAETTTFPSVHHYIGVRIKDSDVKHTPYFELADGSRQELMPLKVPGSDDVWWIQSSGWDKRTNNRYLSELYRTAGRAELMIQGQKLTIENNTFNFSVSELEYYLADFKNSLWMLILNNSSTVKGNVGKEMPDCFNKEVLELFHDFIQSVEQIVRKPGMVLTESIGKLPLRMVRPVPRTFREYATQPHAKLLTSRTYQESFDTAENRFIHYCVKRVLYVLKSLSRVADAQGRSYIQKIKQEYEFLEGIHKSDVKKVDSKVYDNEIAKIEGDLEGLTKRLSGMVSAGRSNTENQSAKDYGTYTVRFGDLYGNSFNVYFADRLDGYHFRSKHGTYLVIKIPSSVDISKKTHDELSRWDVAISGRYIRRKKFNSNNNHYWELEFFDIASASIEMHPWEQEISNLIDHRKQLERDNWIVPLTKEERQDRVMEIDVSTRKTKLYENMQEKMSLFSSSLPALHNRLVKVATFFSEHRVGARSDCPNTMTFIQNPSYASSKSQFKKISTLNGLDEFMLNSLMIFDDIGLVNVANIYEKWCLLQIIKVLNQVFGFGIESGWQRTLIDAVLTNAVNVEIKLHAENRQQDILLTYEKVLDSDKRPDFVLDLFSKEYVSDQNDPTGQVVSTGKRNRLILDAKFRGQMAEKEFHDLVSELYETKDYSEGGSNQVFVIHPSPNIIDDRTSPLEWGVQCDYGQSHEIGHQYGGIFVAPSLTYSSTLNHLQRLIGMFLQQKSNIVRDDSGSGNWHNMTCISCGNSADDSLSLVYEPTKAGSERWVIKCNSCGLLTVKTICWHCYHPLFKNGPKWTYHRTRAEQTSNVVCPKCETLL